LAIAFWCEPICAAQNKNKNNKNSAQEKRDDQRIKEEKEDVKEAQDKLKNDQKDLQEAQKALGDAEAKEKAGRQKLDEVRKRIEAKAESGSGIDNALAAQEAAKKSYDAAAAPVLKSLKATPAYQAAAKKVADADARLKAIRADESLSAETKRKEISQASKDKLATNELEQTALESDSSANSARAKLADAQDRVNQIRAKIRHQIDSDPEIKSSLQAMRSAADATEVAGQKIQRIRDKIAADQAKLAREQQQVKQAEAADKANDNKNQTNNKKPNNKGKR
jgi:colicin import membrane protein